MGIDYRKVKKYWNRIDDFYGGVYSPNYRIINDEPLGFYRFKKELSFIKRFLPNTRESLLDIGCGTGNFISHLKNDFNTITGIDLSEEMVKTSEQRFQKIPNITIIRANILEYNFPKHIKYDLILIGEVLLYISDEDLINLFNKLKEVAHSKSVIIVRETVARQNTIIQERDSHMAIRRTFDDYKKLFKEAGFKIATATQNYYYNYTGIAGVYRRRIASVKRLRMSFFENKIVEVLLLNIPFMLLLSFKKNLIINYFFVLQIG